MAEPHAIHSDAFRTAALRSERFRIIGLIGVFTALGLINVILGLAAHSREALIRRGSYFSFWLLCAAFEAAVLWTTIRAQRKNRRVRTWIWLLSNFIECSLPTVAILGLTADTRYIGPYRALFSPAALLYSFFIILSTLRLNPALCIFSGLVSAGGYLAVYLLTLHLLPENGSRFTMPGMAYAFNGIVLLGSGMIAAAVAHEIRRHVVAALNEAETRRRLDRMEHDLQIARSIQLDLLPSRPPSIDGYDVAGFSVPADQTGGDLYDWIESRDGQMLFTIADAIGHGMGPALLIAACRAYVRAIAARNEPLDRMMAQMDKLVAADVQDGRFITAALALLDPHQNRLSLYSAGHAPIYLYRALSDQIECFEADQPPLGTNLDCESGAARVIALAPGDMLVLVTDGFFECRSSTGEQLGAARLGEYIRLHRTCAARDIISLLHERVVTFSQGAPQVDDLTAVVIKRLAACNEAAVSINA
jgi:serine phosphatase RsbU (regulator of sigma subunit)